MDVESAIRERRTHKAFGPDPVDRQTLDELLELARWAPNHNLTNPWRFRVLGPDALARLKEAAGPESAAKLDRAPTLIAASQVRSDDAVQDEEDLCAAAAASYIVLLGAHARRRAGGPRTRILRPGRGGRRDHGRRSGPRRGLARLQRGPAREVGLRRRH